MKKTFVIILFGLLAGCQYKKTDSEQKIGYYQPWSDLEELFHDVQMAKVFEDSKTFVDCVPKFSPETILQSYRAQKNDKDFDLSKFVYQNFDLPENNLQEINEAKRTKNDEEEIIAPILARSCTNCKNAHDTTIYTHLSNLWNDLVREVNTPDSLSTIIPLQHQYVVPGGRFREVYYWDSYFTMIGLGVTGRIDLIVSMTDNFAYLIDSLGFIPNGNRSYYLGRSQPPFFASMVNLVAQYEGGGRALKYLPSLRKEYDYWMEGQNDLKGDVRAKNRVVRLKEGHVLNRYWDELDSPRPESYREDFELAENVANKNRLYRNLRAGAASGWDYSTRWFEDKETFSTIHTVDILPVDLNCLIFNMEYTLHELYNLAGDTATSKVFYKKAEERKKIINDVFWNSYLNGYTDYVWTDDNQENQITLACMYPMYFKIADLQKANEMVKTVKEILLKPGGLVTTNVLSGQQWDAPNGWAPLQWISIKGLHHYGFESLSSDITRRWVGLNKKVFFNTGKMMEKYNVVDTTLIAGGGEYPTQDGFGWTNGVLLGLLSENPIY